MGGGNGESYTNGVIVKLSSHLNPYMNCHVVVVPHLMVKLLYRFITYVINPVLLRLLKTTKTNKYFTPPNQKIPLLKNGNYSNYFIRDRLNQLH
jgi:hypothetical protein